MATPFKLPFALFYAICLLYIEFQGSCHRRSVWKWSLYIEDKSGITNRFCRRGAKGRNTRIVLLELREVDEQRVDARWAKESQYVVKYFLQIRKIRGYGVIDNGFGIM